MEGLLLSYPEMVSAKLRFIPYQATLAPAIHPVSP